MATEQDFNKWFFHTVLFEPDPGYAFGWGANLLYPGADKNIILDTDRPGWWSQVQDGDLGYVTYIYIDEEGQYGEPGGEFAETEYFRYIVMDQDWWEAQAASGELGGQGETLFMTLILDYFRAVIPDRFQWWDQIAIPVSRYRDRVALSSYGQTPAGSLFEVMGIDASTLTSSPIEDEKKTDLTPLIFAAIGGVTGGAPGALAGFLFSLVTQQKDNADKQKTVSTERVTASTVGIPSGIGFNI
jgi:hypothetical protein